MSRRALVAKTYKLYLGGAFVRSESGRSDPTTAHDGAHVANVPRSSRKDVRDAVKAARAAQAGWARRTAYNRGQVLYRFAEALESRSDELARAAVAQQDASLANARAELAAAVDLLVHYAGWTDKLSAVMGGINPVAAPYLSFSAPEPTGVMAVLAPDEPDLLGLIREVAPALAAGNTVVLKPAETTPLSALLFCDVLRQAELPPGVVNIVTGDGSTGAEIVTHPGVDKIAFTGSTEVGKAIQREVAGSGKRLTLELGGKAANIVFDDAALDQAVEGIVNGIYFNQGHVCCAGSRLFVQESVYEDVLRKLKRRMGTLRVGDPLDKNTDVGAINSRQQLDKISELVRAGEEEGAEIYQPPCRLPEKGYWFAPTVFTNVAQSYRIAQEEIFGPVLSVLTFRTPAEAIEKANNTPYGLSAGVWTEKGSRILWMAQHLRAGVIWANTYNRFDPASPFGGYKESGFGREGGLHGLEPYLDFE